jgi:V8-like Glu-specific endopeptidase
MLPVRRQRWIFTFAVAALATGSTAWAAESLVLGHRVQNPKAVAEYWTAERYANAQPYEAELDLAALEAAADDLAAELDAALGPEAAEGSSEPGYPPTVNLRPQPQRLFSPADRWIADPVEPQSVGSGGGHYTSSRVHPAGVEEFYPYRTVGKIYFSYGGQNFVCSGAVIRKRLVLTAGHCLHQGKGGQNGFHSNVRFVPGLRNGDAPYGQWTAAYLWVTNAWATSNGVVPNTADFAVIELNDLRINGVVRKAGDVLGTLGWITNRLLTANHLTLLGYPASMDSGLIMHRVDSAFKLKTNKNTAEYGSDMTGGSSGGPWVQDFGEKATGQTYVGGGSGNQVVGVTSYGYNNAAVKLQGASNFTSNLFTGLINSACARRAGNC